MDDYKTWVFPKNISIETVSEYVEQLKNVKSGDIATFDLSKTTAIHSSFIGFLIHAKQHLNKTNCKLTLVLSLTAERILVMLNLYDYFNSEIAVSLNKKTA